MYSLYLHLGQDVVVRNRDIVGIFDLEKASLSKWTRAFLSSATKEGRVVTVSYEMPKSFIVTAQNQVIYLPDIRINPEKTRLRRHSSVRGKTLGALPPNLCQRGPVPFGNPSSF